METVLQSNDSVYASLNHLKDSGGIIGFSSLGSLVHSKKRQTEKIGLWKEFWTDDRIRSVSASLGEAGLEYGFKPGTFDPFYGFLRSDFQPLEIADYHMMNAFPVEDYLSTKNRLITATSMVKLDSSQIEGVRQTFARYPETVLIDRQGMW